MMRGFGTERARVERFRLLARKLLHELGWLARGITVLDPAHLREVALASPGDGLAQVLPRDEMAWLLETLGGQSPMPPHRPKSGLPRNLNPRADLLLEAMRWGRGDPVEAILAADRYLVELKLDGVDGHKLRLLLAMADFVVARSAERRLH